VNAIARACSAVLIAAVVACNNGGGPRSPVGPAKNAPSGDETACGALCDDEARCGDATKGCLAACTRTAALLKAGVVERIADCRRASLEANCYGKDSAFTHGDLLSDARCFREGAAPFAADASNRRNWATASCDRMLRCQQTDPSPAARKLCIDASTNPAEEEDREAMTVVDALRDEVVKGWADCLAKGACPAPGKADAVEEQCVLAALGKVPSEKAAP
jgi:hypothetical protein